MTVKMDTNMADPIFEAISLNNKGAYHLVVDEDFTNAMSSFLSALMKTEELLSVCKADHQMNSSDLRHDAESIQLEFVDLDTSSSLCDEAIVLGNGCHKNQWDIANDAAANTERHADDSLFICKSAIMIYRGIKSKESSLHLVPKVAFSAVYNLAIANHLYGIRHRSLHHLQRALHLYGLSHTLRTDDSFCSNSKHELSVLNNMAMIHRHMGDESKSIEYLRRLCTVMSCVDEKGRERDQRNWRGFLSNIADLYLGNSAAAASA
eukprot:scaffold3254_cov98-Cylindrotheca_fusiformis.AAC.5